MKTTVTNNTIAGFFGALRVNLNLEEDRIAETFDRAAQQLARGSNVSPEIARDFLDSKCGRWLADTITNEAELKGPIFAARMVAGKRSFISWMKETGMISRTEAWARESKRKQEAIDKELLAIARHHLLLETLESRGRDSLDFPEVGIKSLKDALRAAYAAGRLSR